MSGIGLVLNVAKDALLSQQYALGVTGHNIANVNTEGYSRQRVDLEAKEAVPYAGVLMGRGVGVAGVTRIADRFIETSISERTSDMTSLEEAEGYMRVLEGIFNETSGNGLSAQMAEFWNGWHDLANNPPGDPERAMLYERGVQLTDAFNSLDADLAQFSTELNLSINTGVEEVNEITAAIADLNTRIVGLESGRVANDLRDKRTVLLRGLSEYLGCKSFEQENGSVTVTMSKGCVLVQGNEHYNMTTVDNKIKLKSSIVSEVDLTASITGGKLGGWLDMRDELIPEYQADLDASARSFMGEVNKVHSEGMGLSYFDSATTGTYTADSSGMLSTLDFGQGIDYDKDLTVWIHDSKGTADSIDDDIDSITIDMGISSPQSPLIGGAGTADRTYRFTVTQGGAVGTDTQIIRWESFDLSGNPVANGEVGGVPGINGVGSYDVEGPGPMQLTVADGDTLVEGNTFTINTSDTGAPIPLSATVSGTGNSALDTYVFKVAGGGGGTIGTDAVTLNWSNTITSGTIEVPAAGGDVAVDGMIVNFTSGLLFEDDTFVVTTDSNRNPTLTTSSDWHWTINSLAGQINKEITDESLTGLTASGATALTLTPDSSDYSYAFSDDGSNVLAALGINTFFAGREAGTMTVNSLLDNNDNIAAARVDPEGALVVGDNSNALDMADLQYEEVSVAKWSYSRGSAATSKDVLCSLEDYCHALASSIGVKSESISREKEYSESIVNNMTEIRNSISGVSLDEEMTNLIKFQHAYVAAAKLISVADEMLTRLIDVK